MAQKNHTGKIVTIVLVLFLAAIAGAGYYSFRGMALDASAANAAKPADANAPTANDKPIDAPPTAAQIAMLTAAQADDIVYGKENAPVTILAYASLSCPHCAHFEEKVFPDVRKEFIDTGKARFVFRHFPHNEPGLRAAQLVNCADAKQRPAFVKVLYDAQDSWAFSSDFLKNLKPLVAVGGMDSAAFDTCIANKAGETRILEGRKLADSAGHVTSVPTFFINGAIMSETPTIEHFRDAIAASTPKK